MPVLYRWNAGSLSIDRVRMQVWLAPLSPFPSFHFFLLSLLPLRTQQRKLSSTVNNFGWPRF